MLLQSFTFCPRQLRADAPTCQPCPPAAGPALPEVPTRPAYSIADCSRATARCQEVAQAHPSWPTSRTRAAVAREMNISTVTLRYLLRRAAA